MLHQQQHNPPSRPVHQSTEIYRHTLVALPDLLTDTLKQAIDERILISIESARRIIFTGCGSSWPVAFAAADMFSANGFAASSEYTSQILSKGSLNETDVVVLISQGWNRSDACRVTQKVLSSSARLVVLTGRSSHRERHLFVARSTDAGERLFTLQIEPSHEKLFCRPASPITSFAQLCRVLESLSGETGTVSGVCEDVYQVTKQEAPTPPFFGSIPQKLVILGSGGLFAAAQAIALMMREGAGIDTEAYECEAYGHGFYVPHQYMSQADPQTVTYVLLTQSRDETGPSRILPLLRDTRTNFDVWESKATGPRAFVQHVLTGSNLVLSLNKQTGFDMNTPPGLEENRWFHEEGGL